MNDYPCPHCNEPVFPQPQITDLSKELECPNCCQKVYVHHDYPGEGYDLSIWYSKEV